MQQKNLVVMKFNLRHPVKRILDLRDEVLFNVSLDSGFDRLGQRIIMYLTGEPMFQGSQRQSKNLKIKQQSKDKKVKHLIIRR